MKTGRSLVDLAAEIQRQADNARDYVVRTDALKMAVEGTEGKLIVNGTDFQPLPLTEHAHQQLATYLKIPREYYDKMRIEQPELMADNVNGWLATKQEKRMIRTLDGRGRAFLSSGYRPLNNFHLAEAVLPVLGELKVQVVSAEVTEKKFYLKVVDSKISGSIPRGHAMGDGSHEIFDTLCAAMTITNSEIGLGALAINSGVLTRACTNLAFFEQKSLKKYHVGSRQEIGEEMYKLLTDDTRKKTDAALWAQARDVVRAAFNQAEFDANIKQIAGLTEQKIDKDTVAVVELTGKYFGMQENERKGVLQHLIEGGDLSRYGLFNAITRTAEDLDSYDRASDFERFGGEFAKMDEKQWAAVQAA